MKLIHYTHNHPGLTAWSPFNRLATWADLFETAFETGHGAWAPPLDLLDRGGHLEVRLELAGMKREDFDITLEDDTLTIAGRREVSNAVRNERPGGSFSRSVTLPSPVESAQATASYENGVLTIRLPKTEAAKPRRITVGNN
jgi:HSP20 family protein